MRLKIQYRIGFPQPHLSHTILISISISISISMIGPQCKCIHCLQYYLTDIQYFQGKSYPLHLQILSDRHAANNTQKGCMEDNVHYNTRNYSYLMYAFLPTLSVSHLAPLFPPNFRGQSYMPAAADQCHSIHIFTSFLSFLRRHQQTSQDSPDSTLACAELHSEVQAFVKHYLHWTALMPASVHPAVPYPSSPHP